jgi:hypothetical protein
MRILLAIFASLILLTQTLQAQTHLPVYPWGLGVSQWQPFGTPYNFNSTQKWQLRPSAAISAGYIFYGRGISYLAAPLALNLYHPLTSNLTAFGGVSVTPTILNFNSAPFQNAGFPGNHYDLRINPAVQGGLIYTNDAHTFSISGSVILERSSYPVYAPPQNNNTKRQY